MFTDCKAFLLAFTDTQLLAMFLQERFTFLKSGAAGATKKTKILRAEVVCVSVCVCA